MSKSHNNNHRASLQKTLSDDDRALFRDQTSDITPYQDTQEPPPKPKRIASKKHQVHSFDDNPGTPIDPWPQGKGLQPALTAADRIDWSRHGLSTRAKQHLRKKKLSRAQQCDLHGLTIDEASIKVDNFLMHAFANNWRSVMIIHGKGSARAPVLKNWLLPFLQSISGVQAIVSAHMQLGGTGAVMVQLNKLRNTP